MLPQQFINNAMLGFTALVASLLLGPTDFQTSHVPDKAKVDFIVVGSGSSGGVIAARLAEEQSWSVLLLEAGGQPLPQSRIPGFSLYGMPQDSPASWNYKTTPQKYSQFNYIGNANLFPRGKSVGGSSSINFMMYNRGNSRDYDRWAALGNPGWDYKTVLKYFKKSENYKGKLTRETAPFHGRGGPLTVENKLWGTPVMGAYLAAGRELGYPSIDNNGRSQIGFSTPDVTIKKGERASVAEAFLRPILGWSNFQLKAQAHVIKILFDDNLKAIGVRYIYKNRVQEAYARREVIISAGAINSPQLLMLSGIGPKKHLRQMGMKPLVDLPGVGQNLQDHPSVWGMTWLVNKGDASSFGRILSPKAKLQYLTSRSGPLSAPHGMEGNAWVRLGDGPDREFPDIQFLIVALTLSIDFGFIISPTVGIKPEVYNEYYKPIQGREGFNIGPMLTVPKSRGSVTLRSRNPLHPPNIDPNFLSHPDDVTHFVKAIRFAHRIGNTTVMRDTVGAKFYDKPLPGCQHLEYGSDDYWACFTRHMVSTTYHPTSTCKMAPDGDPMGVVNPRLKVRGVTGLRVADASIMPIITTGNTNAPCIMIGERAADLIKEDNLY